MDIRTIAAQTHGRYLVDTSEENVATLVGFHGYQENAAIMLDVLRQITELRAVDLVSIQGLHRFYNRSNDVVASWMTSEDREQAIADNVAYVGQVLSSVADEFGVKRPLIYAGFSQGVAMAYRAAALTPRPCAGIIALAGDLPPDVVPVAGTLPRVLLGRGSEDKWYTAEKAGADLKILNEAGVAVSEHVFEGGHAWSMPFIYRCAAFVDELLS